MILVKAKVLYHNKFMSTEEQSKAAFYLTWSHPWNEFHPLPSFLWYLAITKISVLLYLDYLVLLLLNKTSLKRILTKFRELCKDELLTIHYSKTKIMDCGKRVPKYNWLLNRHGFEQVHSFRYLGLHFAKRFSGQQHLNATAYLSTRSIGQLKRLFFVKLQEDAC